MLSSFFLSSFAAEPQNQPPKVAICEFDKTFFYNLVVGGAILLTYPIYMMDCSLCKRFPQFDLLGPGNLTIWSTLGTLPLIPQIQMIKIFKKLNQHAEIVENLLRESYGSTDLLVPSIMNHPFAKPDIISNSSGGIFIPYFLFLKRLEAGAVLFQAAGNDGEPIASSCFFKNHANANHVSLFFARIYQRFNIYGYKEKECQRYPRTIFCGVADDTGLGLKSYSNYSSMLRDLSFFAIRLPKGCPEGTSYATPIIAGIFCRLREEYPIRTNDEIFALMKDSARTIYNCSATRELIRYAEKIRPLDVKERQQCRLIFIETSKQRKKQSETSLGESERLWKLLMSCHDTSACTALDNLLISVTQSWCHVFEGNSPAVVLKILDRRKLYQEAFQRRGEVPPEEVWFPENEELKRLLEDSHRWRKMISESSPTETTHNTVSPAA